MKTFVRLGNEIREVESDIEGSEGISVEPGFLKAEMALENGETVDVTGKDLFVTAIG